MGGCRCSYKSCKARTDGQTHMFHFPVYDKLRCHQWITNAMKPNFLNLMLSQLKNRVVCQHHFRDECFMNYKRKKLKTTAVPTEDGPFCTSAELIEPLEDDEPVITINADDIENEIMNYIEKKANSSVKYGDFLISDKTELFNTTQNSSGSLVNTPKWLGAHNKGNNYTINYTNAQWPTAQSSPKSASYSIINRPHLKTELHHTKMDMPEMFGPQQDSGTPTILNNEIPVQTNSFSKAMPHLSVVSIEYDEAEAKLSGNTLHAGSRAMATKGDGNQACRPKSATRNPNKFVKIISEKTISEPLRIEGKLESISPSIIVNASSRSQRIKNWHKLETKNENFVKTELHTSNTVDNVQASNEQILPIEYVPTPMVYLDSNIPLLEDKNLNEENINIETQTVMMNQNNKESESQTVLNDYLKQDDNQTQPSEVIGHNSESAKVINQPENTPKIQTKAHKNRSIVKSKIPPEKLAAIEEKRKYNLKLRDVINSCTGNSVGGSEVFDKDLLEEIQQKLGSLNSNIPNSPSSQSTKQDSMIAYLENRLQRMEETLLNKIDHNTYKINDLKRAIKPSYGVKSTSTQTHSTMKDHKQYLYREISKYLSPSASSTVYGELFLNTENDAEASTSSPKKRRRRR